MPTLRRACGHGTGVGRCPTCARAYERARPSRQARGLDADHERRRRPLIGQPCALRLPGCTGVADTADHVIPRKLGGARGPLQPACRSCNASKGARVIV